MPTELLRQGRMLGEIYLRRAYVAYYARIRGDLFSRFAYPGDRTDPYALIEQIRTRGPMVPTRLGNWGTTSYRVAQEVLRNRAFSVTPADGSPDTVHGDALDLSILALNPPDHTRLRRLAAPAFTPRRMTAYVELVDSAIDTLLDEAERLGEFDLVAQFAAPLPITVMTHLLGVPGDTERFRRLGSVIGQALDGVWSMRQARTLTAADAELEEIFAELLILRATEPGDDLVSALVAQQGDQLSAIELTALARLLLLAGFETTVNAIGSGVRWLLADPDQWALLADDPERAPAAAEEALRFDAPVQQTIRVANRDLELGGVQIATNQWVIALLAGANRDPEVFPNPNHFDIARESPAEHLSFSGGIHYCLGSPLARMEIARALRALAIRFPRLRPNGPISMRTGSTLRGPALFPVTVC